VTVDLDCPAHFAPTSPLSESKNYLDIKAAIRDHYPDGLHYTLIEAVADHIISFLFAADQRVRRVKVKIIKTAISLEGEAIGITLTRSRPESLVA
jgi:dihydroneopterin aldolase